MKVGLEAEIRMKIEIIKARGEETYKRIREARPELSIIEIHQLVVAAKSVHIPFDGISNAEYRYRTIQSRVYNQYMGRGGRCNKSESKKTIQDYCEKNNYSEIAEKKAKSNFVKNIIISAISYTFFTIIFASIIILASVLR